MRRRWTAPLTPTPPAATPAVSSQIPSASDWARHAVHFHPDPIQVPILDCADRRVIIAASRQSGKSSLAALRALYLAVHTPRSLVLLVGPVGSQAGEILAKARAFAAELGLPLRGDGNNQRSLQLPNGSRLVARPAVPHSLRSYSKACLIIVDEAAFVPDAAFRALSPILAAAQGALWVLSTPMTRAGLFAELWHDTANGFTRFRILATECPRLTPDFLAGELRLHGELSFAREYMCQFLSTGVQLLSPDQIAAAVVPAPYVPPFALRERSALFYALDLGKRQDHTALVLLELAWAYGDVDPATRAAALLPRLTLRFAGRLPLDSDTTGIPRYVRDTAQRFAPAYAAPHLRASLLVDATGNGHTVIELLRQQPHGLLLKPVCISSGRTAKSLKDGYASIPRADLLSRLKMLFETGALHLDASAPGFDHLRTELLQFEPSGQQQEHDDLVMALSLAAWQATTDHPSILGLREAPPALPRRRLI